MEEESVLLLAFEEELLELLLLELELVVLELVVRESGVAVFIWAALQN